MGNSTFTINCLAEDDEKNTKKYTINNNIVCKVNQNNIKAVDLTTYAPEIYNQHMTPCKITPDNTDLLLSAPNAICAAYEYMYTVNNTKDNIIPSRLFVYFNAKSNTKTIVKNITVSFVNCIDGIKKYGICSEALWPYDMQKSTFTPVDECYSEAKTTKIASFYRLTKDLQKMKAILINGEPFMFGFNIFNDFPNLNQQNSTLKIPYNGQIPMGKFGTICMGFNDYKQAFYCRGCFGKIWGDNGYFWIPYDYVTGEHSFDFWMVRMHANNY